MAEHRNPIAHGLVNFPHSHEALRIIFGRGQGSLLLLDPVVNAMDLRDELLLRRRDFRLLGTMFRRDDDVRRWSDNDVRRWSWTQRKYDFSGKRHSGRPAILHRRLKSPSRFYHRYGRLIEPRKPTRFENLNVPDGAILKNDIAQTRSALLFGFDRFGRIIGCRNGVRCNGYGACRRFGARAS